MLLNKAVRAPWGRAQRTSASQCTRLRAVRSNIRELGVDALIVGSADSHQSEYVAAIDERRQYISRFTGSAGTALITQGDALIWTDGRYYTQAETELGKDWKMMKSDGIGPTLEAWLYQWCGNDTSDEVQRKIGVDPRYISSQEASSLQKMLESVSAELVPTPTDANPIDVVWAADSESSVPLAPNAPVSVLSLDTCGEAVQSKVERVITRMSEQNVGLLCISALDEVAWLFNLRGADIAYNPVFFAFATITDTGFVALYISEEKLDAAAREHLDSCLPPNVLTLRPYESVYTDIPVAAAAATRERVWLSGSSSSWAMRMAVPEQYEILDDASPITALKAVKNDAEVTGMRNCHRRDAVAMVSFLCWLEQSCEVAEDGRLLPPPRDRDSEHEFLDEVSAAAKLAEFRALQEHHKGPSFDTIFGCGGNGAIIHYRAQRDGYVPCKELSVNEMILLDSGAQYADGTTDLTRTFHLGTPTEVERECFTRVLKGHIALGSARFPVPAGTTGYMLDAITRRPLWEGGLDYAHGTGHGVGHYLNVHEGPHSLSPHARPAALTPLVAGMVTSNEPGFYLPDNEASDGCEGGFGIRCENLLLVVKDNAARGSHLKHMNEFLAFEDLTMVPFQASLLVPELLTEPEIQWLDDYHSNVWKAVSPVLDSGHEKEREWLRRNTLPLAEQIPLTKGRL